MKHFLVSLLLFLATSSTSFSSDLLISVSIDWGLSIRGGIEYQFHPNIGIKADAGVSIGGTIVADAFWVFYIMPEDKPLRLNFLIGIPNASVPFTFNAAMVSFGASLLAGYKFTESVSIDLRLGAGFPLFFESGKEMIRDIGFPLDLWPDAVLGLNFKI